METGLTMLGQIQEQFACAGQDIRTYSPLTLAYIGDCIFDVIVRSVIVLRGNRAVNAMHQAASRIVKAQAQARMVEALYGELTEEEQEIYKRGKNAKSHTSAKNASLGDYHKATGYEALIGYLYLTGQMERVLFLVKCGMDRQGLSL